MYQRILQQKLEVLSAQWSIISVTGPRQSGKTTLCKMTFPDYEYINLERFTTRELNANLTRSKFSLREIKNNS